MSTGAEHHIKDGLKRRHVDPDDLEIDEIIEKTESLKLNEQKKSFCNSKSFHTFSLLFLTCVSSVVRLHRLGKTGYVVWDEAHFGKFGSHYLQREYYFDVHPPLGKLLVALSGYIAGYEGGFGFDSGATYPEDCNYLVMRCLNSIFGILCTPFAYLTAVSAGYSTATTWLITLSVVFETISMTLAKFILLDSFLLFFTVLTFYCLVKYHNMRVQNDTLSLRGFYWLSLTGISVGCVCSVKWVGLFITLVVGVYTIYDLYIKHFELLTQRISWKQYFSTWVSRIFTLIVIPFTIYLTCFKIHFMVLNRSGTGDGQISSLLQASLEGNKIKSGPRTVTFGSLVTLRSHGLSPNLLHSHGHLYPEGSQQQQITTYGYKDENNDFLIEFDLETGAQGIFATDIPEGDNLTHHKVSVKNGDTIRLIHKETGSLLHSHLIPAFITKTSFEVSCYGNLDISDIRDEWVVEIVEQQVSPDAFFHNETQHEIHPISTNLRLRHKEVGCYLATTGYQYPSWGFGQGEVVCKYSLSNKDKTTWWNVEDHVNDLLEKPEKPYVPPKPKFWKEFILLNYAMMTSNNALVPDPDKFDRLASEWWQWPTAYVGLRMCGWSSSDIKYFLIGQPAVTWGSTLALGAFLIYSLVNLWRWQRQKLNYVKGGIHDPAWNSFIVQGILPFLAWLFNYVPFIAMGRVTYVHHYAPALYFAIFILGFMVETLSKKLPLSLGKCLYLICYLAIIGTFVYFKDLAWGMEGPSSNYKYLRLLSTWMI